MITLPYDFKLFIIVAPVASYERIWFFMDEFGSNSFEKHFKPLDGYVKSHFDISGWSNNSFSNNPSMISRLANLMKAATSSQQKGQKLKPLPKLIVVVADDNIIETLSTAPKEDMTKALGMLVNFVMTEHERGISSFKESLTAKSRREEYPHIMWVLPPSHDKFKNNSERYKFGKAVEDACKFHTNISALELKKVWEPKDPSLIEKERFTSIGYKKYWEAVDRTVRYCDAVVLKKKPKKFNKNGNCQKDKYKWHNPKIVGDVKKFQDFRRLPSPPPKQRKY